MKKLTYMLVASIILFGCAGNETKKDSKAEANAASVQAFYDQVLNGHNPAMMDSFCSADIIDHQMDQYEGGNQGLEAVKAMMTEFFTAYPDLDIKANYIKAWGDTVMAHFTMTGTNKGPMMGMPATNKPVKIEGVDLVVFKDGKMSQHWGYQEDMKWMQQLGMMDNMPKEGEAGKMEETKK